jgi:hypothetical protein
MIEHLAMGALVLERLVFELSKDMRAYREAKARAQAEGLI